MRNQQTDKDVLDLLNKGGKVTINLTGVSFDNRQSILKSMIRTKASRGVTIHIVADKNVLKYDRFAICVRNSKGKNIGFIPKSKGFSINLPKRKRPVSFGNYIINSKTGKPMQTNEIFWDIVNNKSCGGKILQYLNYGDNDRIPIGVQIEFWVDSN